MIAVDIDGTLLNDPTGDVTDVIAGLNKSLMHYSRRVTLTIATGRAFAGAKRVIHRLNLPRRVPVVLYNGAVVCDADGANLSVLHGLGAESTVSVISLCLSSDLAVLAYQPSESFMTDGDPRADHAPVEHVHGFARLAGAETEFNGLPVRWVLDTAEPLAGVAAMVIPTPGGHDPEFASALRDVPGISVTSSSASHLEVRPECANKGNALAVVAQRRSLDSEWVMAIGDSDNDIEMLRWAGCSVGVANSTPAALTECDYVTRGTAGQGVVEALRLVYDARRQRREP